MARRPVPLSHEEFAAICERLDEGAPTRADLKAAWQATIPAVLGAHLG